jgi:hypothetical protein
LHIQAIKKQLSKFLPIDAKAWRGRDLEDWITTCEVEKEELTSVFSSLFRIYLDSFQTLVERSWETVFEGCESPVCRRRE